MPIGSKAQGRKSGKALRRREGDFLHILFPDHAARALRVLILRHRHRRRDGHGSHHNGRHKLG